MSPGLFKNDINKMCLQIMCVCVYIYIYIYIYKLPYPRGVEFSGEEVIMLPLASIVSLFVDELRSRQPLNRCM